jgi:hypothetical protein
LRPRIIPPPQLSALQPAGQQAQNPALQAPSAGSPTPASESTKHLGPFSIAGQDYTIELRTRKVQPGSTDEQGDTVVAMEIRDSAGVEQYQKMFPYQETNGEFSDSWSVSALPLAGANGTGLLVSYDSYSEPSAPEEEPTGWFQVFGVLNGKLVPFGAPLEVQGGLLDQYADGHMYKAARPLGEKADAVEFKVWTGHCRLIYSVRVDWAAGKLSPAQECVGTVADPGEGCQYKILPEDHLYADGITFVRLWPGPAEKSGQPMKTVVKKDSKVDLLTARIPVRWVEGTSAFAPGSQGPLENVIRVGIGEDADLWLKVRIDGKEGWMHSEEDFRALGLPEDE